jgi:hypothetical protein
MENAWESILMEPIAVDQEVIVARQRGAPMHQNARCRREWALARDRVRSDQ